MGLVVGGRAGGGAGPAREIRDGLLAIVGARFRPPLSTRAPPSTPASGCDRCRPFALLAEFLVELEQRLRQLPAHQGQRRAQWSIVSPGRLYRIRRRAIWRVRAIAVRR